MTLTQITKVKGPGIHTLANIVSNTISLGGIATATNFKTGTSNLHNVGLEIAGINVLGADTPIGTGATIYDAGGAVFTGVVTATKFVGQADISGGSIVGTSATFSGNVSIGGTLTYEDVTNIDAVGIITARDNIKVGSGVTITPAGGAYYAGIVTATTFIGNVTGNVTGTSSGNPTLSNGADNRVITASSASAIQGESSLTYDALELHVNNASPKLKLTDTDNSGIFHLKNVGGVGILTTTDAMIFETGNSTSPERLRIESTGRVGINTTSARVNGVHIYDKHLAINEGYPITWLQPNSSSSRGRMTVDSGGNYLFQFGSGNDEKIRFKSDGKIGIGTNSPSFFTHIQGDGVSSDVLKLTSRGSGQMLQMQNYNGPILCRMLNSAGNAFWDIQHNIDNSFTLDYTDSVKVVIDTNGHITPGAAGTQNLGSTSKEWGHVYLASNKRLYLGSDQSFSAYNDGSGNSVLVAGNNFYLKGNSVYIEANQSEPSAHFNYNGAVKLYFDGGTYSTPKLQTTAIGITVDGEVASSQDYPNYRPTLDFNFASVKKLDPRITYSRIGGASYTDEKGIVRIVGDNVPRFDHDPFTGESKGLLIEDVRTSRLAASTHNDSLSHYKQTDRGETIKGPDGLDNSAREYTVNSDGGTSGSTTIWANEAIGIANATSFSFFVKITRGSTMAFRLFDNNNSRESHKWTISGGYITDGSYATVVQSDPGSTEGTSSYERYPNGWVKCKWENVSASGGNATTYLQLYIYDHASSNGTNIGYGVWGFQVENGAFCTSTIPKPTTAAVSRQEDFVSITGEEHTDIWNRNEGTYLIDYKPLERAVGDGVIIGSKRGNNGSGYPWPLYRHDTANTNNFKSYDLTNSIVSMSTTWADRRESWALGFNGTNGSIVRNGTQLQTNNTNMNGLIDADELWIGSSGTGSMYSMHVKRFMYYSKRITDSQLKTLTS